MATFRSLAADRFPFKSFTDAAANSRGPKSPDGKRGTANTDLPLHLYEWSQSSQDGIEVSGIQSVSELESRDVPTVRVL